MLSSLIFFFALLTNLSLLVLYYVKRSTMVLLPLVLFFLYYFPVFFDVYHGNPSYPSVVVDEANFFSIFVSLNLLVFSLLFYKIKYSLIDANKPIDINTRLIKNYSIIFIVSLCLLTLAVLQSTKGDFFSYAWASRHAENGSNVLFLFSTYFYIASVGIVFILWKENKYKYFLIYLLMALLFVLIIRSRGYLAPIFLCFVFYFFVWQRKVLNSILYSLIFISLFFLLQQFRFLGSLDSGESLSIEKMTSNIIDQIRYGDSELSLRNVYFYYILNYDYLVNNFNFGAHHTYLRILFFWDIFDLGLKPKDFANIMYVSYFGENEYVQHPTMHPTLYGVIYANGMYISSIIFSIFLILFLYIEESIKKLGTTFYWLLVPVLIYCVIFVARGSVNVAFIYLLVICSFSYFMFGLSGRK